MPERMPAPGKEKLSFELSRRSGLGSIKKAIDRVPEQVYSVPPEQMEAYDRELKTLSSLLISLNHWAIMELSRRDKETDPQYENIRRLKDVAYKLHESMEMVRFFSQKLRREGATLDEKERGWLEAAVSQAQGFMKQAAETIEQLPVQSEIVHRFKRRIAATLALTGLTFATLGSTQEPVREKVQQTADAGAPEEEEVDESKEKEPGKDEYEREEAAEGKGDPLVAPRERSSKVPDMEGEGEPGRFDKPNPIASVEKPLLSPIDDALWATSYSEGDGSSATFRTSKDRVTEQEESVAGTVRLHTRDYKEGQTIKLPAPVGFGVANIRIQPNVEATVDPETRKVTFNESAKNVEVSYDVHEAISISVHVDRDSNHIEMLRTDRRQETVRKLDEARPHKIDDILEEHLSDYTYIVSSDMQKILDGIDAPLDEKVDHLRVGDCDVLSEHAARMLDDSHRTTYVASGVLEKNDQLDGNRPHAKVVYRVGGEIRTFETTDKTKNNFVNLKFTPEHMAELQALAQEINEASPEGKEAAYAKMHDRLHQILEDPRYEQYESDEYSEGDFSLKNVLEGLKHSFEDFRIDMPNMYSALATLLASLMLAGAGYGSHRTFRSLHHRIRRRQERETAEVLGQQLTREEHPSESTHEIIRREASRRIRDLYERSPHLAESIPKELLLKAPIEQQREVIDLFEIMEMYVHGNDYEKLYGPMDVMSAVLASREWRAQLKRMQADGVPIEQTIGRMIEALKEPKKLEKAREAIPEKAKQLVELGRKAIVESRMEHASAPDRMERFSRATGLQQLGDRPAKRKRPGIGTEFYDYRKYQPGDDMRLVDWNVYTRTGELVVRQKEAETKALEPAKTFNVLVNVDHMDMDELSDFAALLFYAQRHPNDVHVEDVTITAFGNVIKRMDKQTMDRFFHPPGKINQANITYLVQEILRTKLQYSQNNMYELMRRKFRKAGSHYTNKLYLNLPKDKDYLMVGQEHIGAKYTYMHRMYGFKRLDEDLEALREMDREAA